MMNNEVIALLAAETMAELNLYFSGKNGKVDDKKTMTGKQFWDIQTKAWEQIKKRMNL